MCVVSMLGDAFNEHWKEKWKERTPVNPIIPINPITMTGFTFNPPQVTKEEFAELKKEVELLKVLLKKAKLYDEANNEPDCEIEEKMKMLREIAKFVGIDLDDVLKK